MSQAPCPDSFFFPAVVFRCFCAFYYRDVLDTKVLTYHFQKDTEPNWTDEFSSIPDNVFFGQAAFHGGFEVTCQGEQDFFLHLEVKHTWRNTCDAWWQVLHDTACFVHMSSFGKPSSYAHNTVEVLESKMGEAQAIMEFHHAKWSRIIRKSYTQMDLNFQTSSSRKFLHHTPHTSQDFPGTHAGVWHSKSSFFSTLATTRPLDDTSTTSQGQRFKASGYILVGGFNPFEKY